MFVSPECGKYWVPDHYLPVAHEVTWTNPDFLNYLKTLPGGADDFFRNAAQIVTLLKTGIMGLSHPTGGRVRVIELPKPFTDPATGIDYHEADIKGVLHTTAGHKRDQRLLCHKEHLELNSFIDDPNSWTRGPLSILSANSELTGIRQAASRGIAAPYPGAIIRLDEISFKGQKVKTEDILTHLGFSELHKLGIFIRLYPLTSTRIADILKFPRFELPLGNELVENGAIRPEIMEIMESARDIFTKVELPRLQNYANNPSLTAEKVFEEALARITSNVSRMITHNISPLLLANGRQTTQVHFQNTTTTGLEVEWSPTIDIPLRQGDDKRFFHISELVERYQAAAVALAITTKSPLTGIYPIQDFIERLTIKKSDRNSLYQRYNPDKYIPLVSIADAFLEQLSIL